MAAIQFDLLSPPKKITKQKTIPGGYAAPIGSLGDETKKCRHCKYYWVLGDGRYRKCAKNMSAWTNGFKTDIKGNAPACRYFEENK